MAWSLSRGDSRTVSRLCGARNCSDSDEGVKEYSGKQSQREAETDDTLTLTLTPISPIHFADHEQLWLTYKAIQLVSLR